ncbi:MAG: J domain-containing protein [Myxococcales bacterium]|nr:MAG: J domain-containing protein [Myxococcales bacterium]
MNVDPYAILELPRGAPEAAIRQAFRKLALRYHPDRNPGDAEAEARFKLISAAYQRLKVAGFQAPAASSSQTPRPSTAAPPPWSGASSRAYADEDDDDWEPPPRPEFWPDGQRIHYPTQREIDDLIRSLQRPTTLSSLRSWSDWFVQSASYLYVGLMITFILAGAALLAFVATMGVRDWLGLG